MVLGLAIAAIANRPAAALALAAALAVYLGWQLYNLRRLDWWLRHRSLTDPPNAPGVWGEVVTQIVRLQRRKQFHKRRWIRMFRELRRSTAALPDGVVLLDAQQEIQWFNATAERLIGLDRRADFGIRIDNLVRQPQFIAYLHGGTYATPLVIAHGAGGQTFLSFQIVPYGEGERLLLVRDVTRQTRLEAMRKDFVANASHELRSPLTVISGYLETISQDPSLDPILLGPVEEMRRQAARMTTIIEDLLELSRLEANEQEVAGEPIDIAAQLASLRKDVLARPQHPQVVNVQLDSSAQLLGDARDIHSAFANLVDNAAKYTPPDGSIAMRWWVDADGGHFAVTDTGIGIPAEHLPRLTERFYRVHAGRSRSTGGSGLGLAIVKHVLQRHGAELTITSTEGQGSTFSCRFPLRRILGAGTQSPGRQAAVMAVSQ
jgi:two-component system, OmpR family, phosphate regulon sensor histidine kinase PhoR